MRPTTTTRLSRLAVLVAVLAAGAVAPVAYHSYQRATHPVVPVPPPGSGTDKPVAAAPPPGTEVVPPEESDSEHEPLLAQRPTESFGRAQGLHGTPDPLHLNASAAVVVDGDSGQILAQKNAQAVLPIASLTKLMTTMLVLEAHQPMDEVLTITQDDVDTLRHSRSRLRPGTQLTRQEALHLALMSSENRAAHALARYYPGGVPKLVEAMNAKAKALGMKNTTYVDPTGLLDGNRSTASDLALLVRTAAQNPVMREFTTTPQHLANLGGRVLQYNNSNRLVKNPRWDIELQKTGYIVEAGRCLTMLTRVAGHDLIMVLLDSDSNGTRIADAERLRHLVVAQQGWQEAPVQVARATPEPEAKHGAAARRRPRHEAVASRKADSHGRKKETAVAARSTDKKQVASKRAKGGKEGAVASRSSTHRGHEDVAEGHAGAHRVRQTFVAVKPASHG